MLVFKYLGHYIDGKGFGKGHRFAQGDLLLLEFKFGPGVFEVLFLQVQIKGIRVFKLVDQVFLALFCGYFFILWVNLLRRLFIFSCLFEEKLYIQKQENKNSKNKIDKKKYLTNIK